MRIYVFSYNRGAFLRNCVRSIEICAPDCPLTIVDDGSDDDETRTVLDEAARRHTVVSNTAAADHMHGGLYANMQMAYESAGEDDLICFLQDDTQMVRTMGAEEIEGLRYVFSAEPQLGFVSPAFIRAISLKHRADRDFRFDKRTGLWFWYPRKRSTGVWFSDLLIASARRLRQAQWRFRAGESENNRQAAAMFCRMGRLRAPFAMWLPNGPAYRGKSKSIALRYAERRRACGMYPLEFMSPSSAGELLGADPPRLPVAEECLQLRDVALDPPWTYDPMQGASLLKGLDRLERKLRPNAGRLQRRTS